MNKPFSLVTICVLGAILSGCGGNDNSSSTSVKPATTTPANTTNVTDTGLAPIADYQFRATESKVASGKSTQLLSGKYNCNGKIDTQDTVANLNIFSVFYQNGCYTDTNYSNSNYLIAAGVLSDGTTQYKAYKVSPAQAQAQKFAGSHHQVRMQFAIADDYVVYTYNNQTKMFNQLGEVKAASTSDYTPLPFIDLDQLSSPLTFVVLPTSAEKPSTMQKLGQNFQGAHLSSLPGLAELNLYQVQLDDGLTPKAPQDFNQGPDSHGNVYAQNHYFSLFGLTDSGVGTIWQDKLKYQYYFTHITVAQNTSTIALPTAPVAGNFMLGGATADDNDNLYYLLIEAGNQTHNLAAWLMKTDLNGQLLLKANVTSIIDDLASFGELPVGSNQAVLRVIGNQLGVFYSGVHQNGHQWAEFEIFNTDTLALIKDHGQTASHSFSQVLTRGQDNNFVALDLGDNYPRGILLSRFDDKSKQERVVYSFKTAHSTTAKNSYGVLGQNAHGNTMYRWSNDNRTYTELGGVVDTGNGYLVFFASEHDNKGLVLNNAQAMSHLNSARNLGVVKVVTDFENASGSGVEVSDDLMLLPGDFPAETGEFYGFNGGKYPQRVTGVHWLTQLNPQDLGHNVSRVKTIEIPGKAQVLVLWEEWSQNSYLTTRAMIVDFDGQQVGSIYDLGSLRLNRRDELLYQSGSIWSMTGNARDHSLQIAEFKLL
ncbi:hypothetical protein ACWX0P_29180 [Vibrio mediterranei]